MTKTDGSSRLWVDFWHTMNVHIERKRWTMPDIASKIDAVHITKFMSAFNIRQGYYQVFMAPQDIPETAFVGQKGRYVFKMLLFGFFFVP